MTHLRESDFFFFYGRFYCKLYVLPTKIQKLFFSSHPSGKSENGFLDIAHFVHNCHSCRSPSTFDTMMTRNAQATVVFQEPPEHHDDLSSTMLLARSPSSMDDNNQGSDNETLISLILPYLDRSSLANVSATNRSLLKTVRGRDSLWHPVLQELHQNILPQRFKYKLLRLPPREEKLYGRLWRNGTPSDFVPALVPRKKYSRFTIDIKGDFVDFLLLPGPGVNFKVDIPRNFPVRCGDCNVVVDSTSNLYKHCCSDAHIFAKCSELRDPRRKEGFDRDMSAYEQAKSLGDYCCRVESYFQKAALHPKNQDIFRGVTWQLAQHLKKTAPSILPPTLEVVTESCIRWAIGDYLAGNTAEAIMGVYEGHYRGWHSARFKQNSVFHLD
eukprot:scaffold6661_cov109-Cylindrotheca_fusiformis.AAC.2